MDITKVILRPYHTEKTYSVELIGDIETIAFVVDKHANKHQIKEAFTAIFGLTPQKIRTVVKHPVRTKVATARPGYTKEKKIAYVTLKKGERTPVAEETQA